jgi:uncharacterized membrane protein YgcG
MRDAKQRALDGGRSPQEAVSYALASGSSFLLDALHDNYHDGRFPAPVRSPLQAATRTPWEFWLVMAIMIVLSILVLARTSQRGGSGWGYYASSPHWSTGFGSSWVPSSGGGFGGGGFGGGGFGGGRSGGGGGSGGF